MKQFLRLAFAIIFSLKVSAQGNIGIGTSDPKLKLDVAGAIGSSPGSAAAANSVVIPDNISVFRLTPTAGTQTNTLSVANPENGQYLTIINDDNDPATFAGFSVAGNGGIGNFIYIKAIPAWKQLSDNDANDGWSTTGNAGTVAGTNFLGTTDNVDFVTKTNSTERLRINTSGGMVISNVPSGGNALRVDMTTGVNAASTGIVINSFPSNANARTGIIVDMTNTSNSTGLSISNIGATGMNGISINSTANGNGTGIRIGETTTLGIGINIRGGTGILYNALSAASGTAISIGGTTAPNNGIDATIAGAGTGGIFQSSTAGAGVFGLSISGSYSRPALLPLAGVRGYTATNSNTSAEIAYGIHGTAVRYNASGGTGTYTIGVYGSSTGSATSAGNGLMVGIYGTASVTNIGTSGAIAGQFHATANSGHHLALAATGGANVYLGSTDADRPTNFTGSTVGVGTGNTNTTYMYNTRISGTATFVGSTSGTVGVVAPATVTSYTLTLPSEVAAANGQVLNSTTGGMLSWSNVGSLLTAGTGITISTNTINSVWTQSGNNIYNNNSGNVGVGTLSPTTYKLTVNGTVEGSTYYVNHDSGNVLEVGNDAWIADVNTANMVGISGQGTASNGGLRLGTNTGAYFYSNGTAFIGVGTTTPNDKLDVAGDIRINDNKLTLRTGTDDNHYIQYTATVDGPRIAGYSGIEFYRTANSKVLGTWNNDRLDVNGYLLVGDPGSPTASSTGAQTYAYFTSFDDDDPQRELWYGDDSKCSGSSDWYWSSNPANTAEYDQPGSSGDSEDDCLTSPWIYIPANIAPGSLRAQFYMYYCTEAGFDGLYLEMSVNNGSYVHVTTFTQSGYNSNLNPCSGSDKNGWSGSSGTTIDPIANISSHGAKPGDWVRFRLCAGSDGSVESCFDDIEIYNFRVYGNNQTVSSTYQSGSIYAQGNIFANSNVLLGDVAEYLPVSGESEPGDLIAMIPGKRDEYEVATSTFNNYLVGVHSTNPSVLLNNPASGKPIALTGRVPVKISTENGNIKSGDYLTSSSLKGFAMKADKPCYVIGRALEDFDGQKGRILCIIQPGWYNPSTTNNDFVTGSFSAFPGNKNIRIVDAALSPKSKIFLSFLDNPEQPYWIKEKGENYFIIEFEEPIKKNISFDYFATNVSANQTNDLQVETEIKSETKNESKDYTQNESHHETKGVRITELSEEERNAFPLSVPDANKSYVWTLKSGLIEFVFNPSGKSE